MRRPDRAVAIGIVGAGAVGQTVATSLITSALPERLLLVSRTAGQATALVTDLDDMRQATGSPVRSQACAIEDLAEGAAVVIAVRAPFTNTRQADVRMGGGRANAPVVRAVAGALRGFNGTVLVVTNPVDLMTRLFAEVSGCRRVFGIGSNLDTARYRLLLARSLDVPVHSVRGHVIGEHGDRAVVCASTTTVDELPTTVPLQLIRDELRTRPGLISAGVGRTRAGPAGAVLSTLRKALGFTDGIEELSVAYEDSWLGIPVRFRAGEPIPSLPNLDADERRQFTDTAARLRDAYTALSAFLPPSPSPDVFDERTA
ncbi:lactate dehydrogenase [Streptomyces sp. NPDC056244]|uniref:lactate/malate family dehydrogenase n=1 Tax=Streptomyces sp. NPDC056244 TaxID=3345762 RepID=UPI0035D78C0D